MRASEAELRSGGTRGHRPAFRDVQGHVFGQSSLARSSDARSRFERGHYRERSSRLTVRESTPFSSSW